MLLLIYGLTISSVGLLTVALTPTLRDRVTDYLHAASRTKEELEDLFVVMPRQRLMMMYIGSPLLLALGAWVFVQNLLVIPVGLVVGMMVPRMMVRAVEARRQARFRSQLVDSLLVLSGSLKAGLSILQGLEVLVEESIPPMSEEMGLVLKETRMGLSLDEALKRIKKRMPLDELNLLVTAISVARETGGDITGVFSKLIETIRERHKLKEKLKTLTTIPRLQGWIMASIPFVFAMFVTGVNPEYFEMFLQDPMGQVLAVIAGTVWVVSLALIVWFSRPPM